MDSMYRQELIKKVNDDYDATHIVTAGTCPHWVEFSKRRPLKKSAEYIVATPLYDKKEYIIELLWYCPVQKFECEDSETIKRRYKDDWAFGEYKCGVQLLGVADQNVHYWLEGLEMPKPGRLIDKWLQMEVE